MSDPKLAQQIGEFDLTPGFLKGADLVAEIDRRYMAMKKPAQGAKLVRGGLARG